MSVGNGGNSPRDRSPKTEKRTMLGYGLRCTFNSLEEENPQNKAKMSWRHWRDRTVLGKPEGR